MSRHALPIKWDGHPIVWDLDAGWTPVGDFTFGGGASRLGWRGCRQCHTKILPRMISGRVICPGPRRLVLYRCMTCGYTTVSEITKYGWHEWILDDSDYGDQGSNYMEQGTLI